MLLAFSQRIFNEDSAIHLPAALAWNAFENAIMRLIPNEPKSVNTLDQNATIDHTLANEEGLIEVARARVQIHYIQQHCFVDGEAMLAKCTKLAHIPTIIVQGRYDMVCPPKSAWELARAMPHAQLMIIADAGHSAMEVGVTSALIAATEQFKALPSKN